MQPRHRDRRVDLGDRAVGVGVAAIEHPSPTNLDQIAAKGDAHFRSILQQRQPARRPQVAIRSEINARAPERKHVHPLPFDGDVLHPLVRAAEQIFVHQ